MSAQRGYILPLVLFGTVAILSGIGLLFYTFVYRPQQVDLRPIPTPNNSTPFVTESITDFESCVRAGNPVMESYPRRCNAEGKSFTEVIVESSPIATSSSSVDDGTIYENKFLGFRMKTPGWKMVKEESGNEQYRIYFESAIAKYSFDKTQSSLQSGGERKEINGIEWLVGPLTSGNCVENCVSIGAYTTFREGYSYSLYYQEGFQSEAESVLATFEFI